MTIFIHFRKVQILYDLGQYLSVKFHADDHDLC